LGVGLTTPPCKTIIVTKPSFKGGQSPPRAVAPRRRKKKKKKKKTGITRINTEYWHHGNSGVRLTLRLSGYFTSLYELLRSLQLRIRHVRIIINGGPKGRGLAPEYYPGDRI
jgi:hypothetical protein